jgi:hypothetical protein
MAAEQSPEVEKAADTPEPTAKPKDDNAINLQLIVRGGTTSSAYDMEQARRAADAEKRRKQLDRDIKIGTTPIEQGGGRMFNYNFADPLATPKIHLKYVNSKKEVVMEQLCELITDDISGNKILQFVCPKCVMRGIHAGEAQCTVRDGNRKWHLDTKGAGGIAKVQTVNLRGDKVLEPYLNAGTVMDTDLLICSNYNCGARFKIHKNMLYDWRK